MLTLEVGGVGYVGGMGAPATSVSRTMRRPPRLLARTSNDERGTKAALSLRMKLSLHMNHFLTSVALAVGVSAAACAAPSADDVGTSTGAQAVGDDPTTDVVSAAVAEVKKLTASLDRASPEKRDSKVCDSRDGDYSRTVTRNSQGTLLAFSRMGAGRFTVQGYYYDTNDVLRLAIQRVETDQGCSVDAERVYFDAAEKRILAQRQSAEETAPVTSDWNGCAVSLREGSWSSDATVTLEAMTKAAAQAAVDAPIVCK
jgi:hypothetical protein